jgi:hypothetical protein
MKIDFSQLSKSLQERIRQEMEDWERSLKGEAYKKLMKGKKDD